MGTAMQPLAVGAAAGAAAVAVVWAVWQWATCPSPSTARSAAGTLNSAGFAADEVGRRNGPRKGRIRLVGAGPGDPELLTIAAYRAIREADVVVADRLIPPAIMALVTTPRVFVSTKSPGTADAAQAQLNARVLEAVTAGMDVVRLKGGDPFVFGRGGEEILTYRQQGFEADLIPGVSSSVSGPMCAHIPLTMRGVADQYVVATGHGRGGSRPTLPPFMATRTIILLMAVSRLRSLSDEMATRLGYPPDLPVAVIESANMPGQRVTRGTLASIAARAEAVGVKAPAVVIVGSVVTALDTPP